MSGIVGVFYPTGRPVEITYLQRMLAVLGHRGPDGVQAWSGEAIGLGHCWLRTTSSTYPESAPILQAAVEVITADARIDNRAELLTQLGLNQHSAAWSDDSALILAAYKRWGEACPQKLLGDFAFAIWDPRCDRLFCARDHVGVKPFYYYSSDTIVAFASEIKALLCLPDVPARLSELRVAEYLASMFDDTSITFYDNIRRLPPAHSMVISKHGTSVKRYWSLDPATELIYRSDEDYAEAFGAIFANAVSSRTRPTDSAGSLLSGGLDSSSISCVARDILAVTNRLPLPTFSAVYDEIRECDERPYIDAVLQQQGFDPHFVRGDGLPALQHIDQMLWHQDEPFFAPGLFVSWSLYAAAQKRQVRVLLNGHGGDETVSKGESYLRELAHRRKWFAFAREARGLSTAHNISLTQLAWPYVWSYGLKHLGTRSHSVQRWSRLLLSARGSTSAASIQHNFASAIWNIIADDLVERTRIAERYQESRHNDPQRTNSDRERHYRVLTEGLQPYALETLDKAAAAFSIEQRHPLWDKRLVEFCLALPTSQKLRAGRDRWVFRQAMASVLPREVQRRNDKANFFTNFSRAFLDMERDRLDDIFFNPSNALFDYVNAQQVQHMYRSAIKAGSVNQPREIFALWRAACLELWLRSAQATLRSVREMPIRVHH